MARDDNPSARTDGGSGIVDESKFRPAHGSVPSEINVADDEHPLKKVLGDKAHRKLQAHEGTLGERFAFRYKQARAFVREYLANAETGCIRRAKLELTQYDASTYDKQWFADHSVPEIFDEARNVVGYHPVIEVYSAPPGTNRDRFRIEDNGIGISVEEFVVLTTMGLSASHDDGSQLGNFGQGVMSVFNAVGEYGEVTGTTWSKLDNANYSFRLKIDGTNDLTGTRDEYGTTFKIAAFCDEARDLDVEEAIEEYTEAMYAPVIHHVYDGDGVEDHKEEYVYAPLEDLLPDDAARVTYEDDYIETVASPAIGDSRNQQNPKTFLVTMPISRGESYTHESPWKFHVRLKDESGPIYACTHEDADHTGLIPVDPKRYAEELIEDRGAIHPDQLVPGDLVAYDHPDRDGYIVPHGVDDELVASRDDLEYPPEDGVPEGLITDYPKPNGEWPGVIVDGSHEGLELVDEQTWNEIETDVTEKFVSRDDVELVDQHEINYVDEYDVAMPTPVDDRDRLAEHDGVLFDIVSKRLNENFLDRAEKLCERFGADGFDVWYDLDQADRSFFTKVFEQIVNRTTNKPSAYDIQSAVKNQFDIEFDEETAERIATLFTHVEHARRHSPRPNRKGGRVDKQVKNVLIEAGNDGEIYMGSTITTDKAKLAWVMSDNNQVVSVDGADKYGLYEDLFGWTPLRDLSLHKIDQYDIPDDVADELRRERSGSSGGGGWSGELNPKTREVKIRKDRKQKYRSKTAQEVVDALGADKPIEIPGGSALYLLVFREPDVGGVKVGRTACEGPIARTVVPNYVADYFEEKDLDRAFVIDGRDWEPAIDEIREDMSAIDLETIALENYVDATDDGLEITEDPSTAPARSTEQLADLGPETLALILPERLQDAVDDGDEMSFVDGDNAIGKICSALEDDDVLSEDYEKLAIVSSNEVEQSVLAWGAADQKYADDEETPELIRHDGTRHVTPPTTSWYPGGDVYMDLVLPREVFDRSASEWSLLIGRNSYKIRNQRSDGEELVDFFHHIAANLPEDEPIFPSLK